MQKTKKQKKTTGTLWNSQYICIWYIKKQKKLEKLFEEIMAPYSTIINTKYQFTVQETPQIWSQYREYYSLIHHNHTVERLKYWKHPV